MTLNKTIKKSLKETKKTKETQLIERKIIESRLKMVIGECETEEKFNSLSESDKEKVCFLFLMEVSSLNEEGLISENFIDTLKSIFGVAFWSVPEAYVEKILNSILTAIGVPDNSLKKLLVSFFATNPTELIKSFKDCNVFTKHLVRSILETMTMTLQQEKGYGGLAMDIIRNAIQNGLQKNDFIAGLEKSLSGSICELFQKYSGNAKEVINKIKPAISSAVNPTS